MDFLCKEKGLGSLPTHKKKTNKKAVGFLIQTQSLSPVLFNLT